MIAIVDIIAGISWEPEIRGVLTVAVGVAVLMGSVWLLLVTNTGTRLGTLIALAGFFGWMAIMGFIWWMYGIGWVGPSPTWEIEEFVAGDPNGAATEVVRDLPVDNPDAYAVVLEFGDSAAQQEFVENFDEEQIAAELTAENDAFDDDDPRKLTDEELQAAIDEEIADRQAANEALTLSRLAGVSESTIVVAEDNGVLVFDDWNLLSDAEAGEAVAAADAALVEQGLFGSSAEYIVLDSYQQGGKPERSCDGQFCWDRIWNKITNTLRITHPTNYAVVEVQAVLPQEAGPGEAPPRPMADEEQPVISVVMIRDLGSRRLQPALVTILNLAVFLLLCLQLHQRDLTLKRRQEELAGPGAT